MNIDRAIRLAVIWASGGVCTLRDGEATEYHRMCFQALKWFSERQIADCSGCRWWGVRPQKCSCCRRNANLKDNYEV